MSIHSRLVRLTHWLNAVAVIILILSGWQIYNADPILPFAFPAWATLGGWLGGALLWHFAAMWLFMANLILMIGNGLLSGRWRRKLLPLSPGAILADIRAALRGHLQHDDLSIYNAVQKALYLGVIAALVLVAASGLAIWKPVQLAWLTDLFGGFQGARIAHFIAMAGIAGFLVVHAAMALIVPKSLRAMLRGH